MAFGSSVVAFVGIAAAAGIPGIALLRAGGGNDGSGEAVGNNLLFEIALEAETSRANIVMNLTLCT